MVDIQVVLGDSFGREDPRSRADTHDEDHHQDQYLDDSKEIIQINATLSPDTMEEASKCSDSNCDTPDCVIACFGSDGREKVLCKGYSIAGHVSKEDEGYAIETCGQESRPFKNILKLKRSERTLPLRETELT
jgi:hypothetical protein